MLSAKCLPYLLTKYNRLADMLSEWLIDELSDSLTDWPTGLQTELLTDWLIYIDWLIWSSSMDLE